jgi:hypothetical protein
MPFDINDQETKDAVEKLISDAVVGLQKKNSELIASLKQAKKGQEIDPQVVADLEEEKDKLHADLVAAQKAVKDLAKSNETIAAQLKSESGFTQKLLIDNGLLAELSKHGVTNPVHQKAAVAMLRGNAQVLADGENRKAMFGDKELSVAISEWASGEEGKHFVTANFNSGGSANGGNGKGASQKSATRAQFDAMNQSERAAFAKDGGAVT